METKKFNYKSEALAFLKLKAAGEKITQGRYCEKRTSETGFNVSAKYFKKVLGQLKREQKPRLRLKTKSPATCSPSKTARVLLADPQWPALRDAYVTGKLKSLRDVARHLNLRPDNRGFREATKGWLEERRALVPAIATKTAEQLAKDGAAVQIRDLYAEALVAHYHLLDIVLDCAENCQKRWQEPDKTPWHSQMAAAAVLDLAKAIEKLLPAIKGLENLKAIHAIFDELSAGKIDIVKAALDLARLGVALPKPIEILLTKHQVDDAPPDDGVVISDAAIMARRAELLAEIQTEKIDFVPQRKRLVAELKAELKSSDSFAAQSKIEKQN